MKLGIIGTGTIASAVVEGVVGHGYPILVSRRSEAQSSRLAAAYENVAVADNQDVIDQADVIFLGLLGDQAPDILGNLSFRADQRVISFMVGPSLETVGQMVAPAVADAIMLPFPNIAKGGSPILALGDTSLINQLFGANNAIFTMRNEAELEAYLCAQAALSPALLLVHIAGSWLGERVVDREQGEAFLRLLIGSNLLSGSNCADMIEALNTPGGYNQRLRLHMEETGLREHLQDGLSKL
ncbi:MAG: NAD(P)-binding domain-containing protein [Cohaesibacter sp.]|nr:NAD(P)-binding domain-containing protein [Cohaesibacter sp.]